jgi:CubicO group peptidase (beta-lactamase class C family)
MNKILLLLLAMLILASAFAQTGIVLRPDGTKIDVKTIDQGVRDLMSNAEVTGICIGIINNHAPVLVKAYGYRNKEAKQLNDTATSFYGASLAKTVFAYLVMQLVDQGKINLDTPLYRYLPKPIPEYESYKDLQGDDRWKLITARHCLDHTTGFPNWRAFNPEGTRKMKIFFNPGLRYAYSGEGLYLLQMVVEVIMQQGLEELAQQYIFKPFNMRKTSFLWQPAFEADYALGHDMNEDTLRKNKRTKSNAAGSMETTIADYTRFAAAMLKGKNISATSWKEMLMPQIGIYTKQQFPSLNNDTTSANKPIGLSYGLGVGLMNTVAGAAFFKEGHDDGWTHYMIGIPSKNYALIIMTNSSNGESIFKELVEKLAGVSIPWKWENYIPYRAFIKLPPESLAAYTGIYQGKLEVLITEEKGQLKIESKQAGLPKSNLYADGKGNFFLKIMQADLKFVKGAGGSIEKLLIDAEGEHFELNKK